MLCARPLLMACSNSPSGPVPRRLHVPLINVLEVGIPSSMLHSGSSPLQGFSWFLSCGVMSSESEGEELN